MGDDKFATRSEVAALRLELRQLCAIVSRLAHRGPADGRLGPLLAQIHAFAHETQWTVRELLQDSMRADLPLWNLLDAIVGPGNQAISLGRWLEKHAGLEVDGYRLQRHKKEGNAWLYSSVKVGLGELAA